MKWTYFPRVAGRAALWQLDPDEAHPRPGDGAKLYIVDYRDCDWGQHEGWCVQIVHDVIATLPYDTPEEELKAVAIALWRLG